MPQRDPPTKALATFLHDPEVTYLNHGSFGATPAELLAVQSELRHELEREAVDFLVRTGPERYRRAREAIAPLLGANADDLAFVPNATTGVNAVLLSQRFARGDEILTTDQCYQGVWNTLCRVAERDGARVLAVATPLPCPDPETMERAVLDAISERTRLLVIDQIASPTGMRLPAEAIARGARARGVAVLVDGAHAPGQIDLDLEHLEADWWVGNLHKWLCAPKGAAVLWARPERQASLEPAISANFRGQGFRAEFEWCGTTDPTAAFTTPAAVALHERMGGAALRAAHHALARAARQVLEPVLDYEPLYPDDGRLYVAMCAFPTGIGEHQAPLLNERLRHEHQIEVPVSAWRGDGWLRISAFAAYNRLEQYDRLASVLPGLLRELRRER